MDKRTFLKISALLSAGTLIDKAGVVKGNLQTPDNVQIGNNVNYIETSSGPSKRSINIREAAHSIPVHDEVDVLVCGGGLGGTAAAIASARAGAKTMLVERNTYLGGVATAGMCCSIFNCFFTGGQERRLVTHGIPLEIADAFAESAGYGQKWRQHKGHIIFDLEQAKLILQILAEKEGVKMLLGTWNAGVVMDGQQLKGVVVENKSGRQAILAKTVVDATGDADIASFSGAPVRVFEAGTNSLCFRFGNVDVDRFLQYFEDNPKEYPEFMDVDWTFAEAMAQYRECGTFLFPHGGGMQMEAFNKAKADGSLPETVGIQNTTNAAQMHALRKTRVVHVITGFTQIGGTDADGITRSVLDGRRMVFSVADAYRKHMPGFENAFVAGVADNLGVRYSRRITGDPQFPGGKAGLRSEDVIGRAVAWNNVIKYPGKNAWSSQVCHEDSFDIPLSCLLPGHVEGLVMGAGRSANTRGSGDLRVMVHTMIVGQGAGVTAAVAAKADSGPRQVPVKSIQDELIRQGAL